MSHCLDRTRRPEAQQNKPQRKITLMTCPQLLNLHRNEPNNRVASVVVPAQTKDADESVSSWLYRGCRLERRATETPVLDFSPAPGSQDPSREDGEGGVPTTVRRHKAPSVRGTRKKWRQRRVGRQGRGPETRT